MKNSASRRSAQVARLLARVVAAVSLGGSAAPTYGSALTWDAQKKSHAVQLGETIAELAFVVTNTGDQPAAITGIEPSCGCTAVDAPPLPWQLAAGASGTLKVKIDLTDKFGEVTKTIRVVSNAGTTETHDLQALITVPVAQPTGAERERTQEMALRNRDLVFTRADCAVCHAKPAVGKHGAALFDAVCGICHAAEHRASMVPDLRVAREPRDAAWWRSWIRDGRRQTLMPAFAEIHGGPLEPDQVESLVEYALTAFPRSPESP